MTRLHKKKVTIEGLTIGYYRIGNGEPLVLIHGLSGSTRWWKRNIAVLSQAYTVYLFDLPGYGSMRRYKKHVPLEAAAAWVVALLQAIGVTTAHFIGHSMGGYICLHIAAKYPEKVNRLILVSSVGLPMNRTVITSLIPLLLALRYVTPAFLPVLVTDALRIGPVQLLRSSREVLQANAEQLLEHVTAPTLLLWGEHDTLIAKVYAAIFRKKITNARLLVIPGAGHVPMFDKPKEFNKAVVAFLDGETVGE